MDLLVRSDGADSLDLVGCVLDLGRVEVSVCCDQPYQEGGDIKWQLAHDIHSLEPCRVQEYLIHRS